LALLRIIKEKNPDIITLLGGANCEASMGQAAKRNFPWIDFVVSGEADLLFPK
jgi:magnesium-protoporphyrin IX monomethyl ester (oxidative) cyclase